MMKIGNKNIGDGHPCFITFEVGPTHNGLDSAKELVSCASEAGADAVKFQILDPDRLISDKQQQFSYQILVDKYKGTTKTVTEPLYDILMRRTLEQNEWLELKQYCDKAGIVFFSTATFYDEVDFLVDIGCDTIKICSGDIDYYQLIRYCAHKNICLQFDTGNATIGEVEKAVDEARQAGNEKIIIHNCPSGYPARLESINLKLIPTLKLLFRCPVAFSDHTPGWEMDIAAVALGANMVEKTITLDRCTPSVEHIFSLEISELKEFVQAIRDIEIALGTPRRIMHEEENKNVLAVRRSIVLSKDCVTGTILNEKIIEYARPGYGIRPELSHYIFGKKLNKDLLKGHMLSFEDIG